MGITTPCHELFFSKTQRERIAFLRGYLRNTEYAVAETSRRAREIEASWSKRVVSQGTVVSDTNELGNTIASYTSRLTELNDLLEAYSNQPPAIGDEYRAKLALVRLEVRMRRLVRELRKLEQAAPVSVAQATS